MNRMSSVFGSHEHLAVTELRNGYQENLTVIEVRSTARLVVRCCKYQSLSNSTPL